DQGWTPLMSVVSAGREEAVDLLLGTEIDVNAKNSSGQTALHYAASKARKPSVIRALLAKGANVNTKDSTGSTPLHRACSAGRFEAVRILVEEGKAKLEARDNTGGTPLYVAAETCQQAIALYLLSKGADVEVGYMFCLPARDDFKAILSGAS
ncbi:hypothetical protein COCSUDRAFT_83670, partial [Coccomyxa subellipsoidea C-169]